jgi:hypothetical protein
MGKKYNNGNRFFLISTVILLVPLTAWSQTTMQEPVLKGTLTEQMNYIQEKTRIYEGYRAIREDMFQKLKVNSLDSLNAAKEDINSLRINAIGKSRTIDSLNANLGQLRASLDKISRTKNSMSFFGVEINKSAYNTVLWTIIVILSSILTAGFLAFKRNHSVTAHNRRECEELRKEFDAYRKASREAREKMSMAHFNELKRLRGA